MSRKVSLFAAGLMVLGSASGASAQSLLERLSPWRDYPKWSEFPAPPVNVPTTADIKGQVEQVAARSQAFEAQVAAIEWDEQEPDRFSADAAARLDPVLSQPVTESIRDEAERFARENRARAVPPPLIE